MLLFGGLVDALGELASDEEEVVYLPGVAVSGLWWCGGWCVRGRWWGPIC